MRHSVAEERSCVLCMVTGEHSISGAMGVKRSMRDARMVKSRFPEISRSNTGSVKNGREIAQEEEGQCDQELLRKKLLLT